MARAIVIDATVAAAADQLLAAGEEPSIIRVQELIGGGSYTTVKRCLDTWRAQRQAAQESVQVPADIMERAAALGRTLWQEATALATQEVAQVRAEVQQQVAEARAAAAEAERAITLREAHAEEQAQQITALQDERAAVRGQLEQATTAAQVAAARLEEQSRRLADLQQQVAAQAAELAQARAALLAQAQLAGEVEALRRQITTPAARPPEAD